MKYHGWPMDAEAAYLDLLGKLSAANARIAELEDILMVKDDCLEIRMSMHDKHIMDRIPPSALKYANDLPIIIRQHSVNMFYALQKATAPSQPTTLPESKQQK